MVTDLNAELGEGFGHWWLTNDEALLAAVSNANVACGFHAGDPSTMRRVCAAAAERETAVGAQVSYRDLAGLGRQAMDVPADELAEEVAYRIGALRVFAEAAGAQVAYVKPHGALCDRMCATRSRRGRSWPECCWTGWTSRTPGRAAAALARAARSPGRHRLRGAAGALRRARPGTGGAAVGGRRGEGGRPPYGRRVPGRLLRLRARLRLPHRVARAAGGPAAGGTAHGGAGGVDRPGRTVHGRLPAYLSRGWQLVDRTDAVLWDPAREPSALLSPGTRVRFEAVP